MGHVPVVLEGHWVVAGCGPVDHERVLGVGLSVGRITARPTTAKDATSTSSLAQTFLRKAATLSAILVTAVAAFVFFLKLNFFF